MQPEDLTLECDRAVRTSRSGDARLGLQIAWHAHRRARAEAEPKGILLAFNTVAICQASSGAHLNALSTAIDAYRMAREIGDRAGSAQAMLTFIAAALDLFEAPGPESVQLQDRCLEEAVALRDVSLQVRVHNVRGTHLVRLGKFDEGLAEYRRALRLIAHSNGTTPAVMVVGNIAHIAVRKAEAAEGEARAAAALEANRLLDEALEMAVSQGATGAEMRAHYNRGWLRCVEGRCEEGLHSYRRALGMASRLKNRSRMADINLGIGDSYMALGRHDAAARAYQAAYAVADDIRPARQIHDACERTAIALERAGESDAAVRARDVAVRERAFYEREREHARVEFGRILAEIG